MNKELFRWAILVLLGVSLAAQGQPWDGSGTAVEPYLIQDSDDMQAIGADSGYWNAHFKLTANIDLSGYTGTQFNIIGNHDHEFTGSFDGDGHIISNFTYTSSGTNYIGLFGLVGGNSNIKNLGMVDVNVDGGDGYYIGGLVGDIWGGSISNCYVTGSVTGNKEVGGLVGGSHNNIITHCYASSSVIGDDPVGGLVGYNSAGASITKCYATGNVTGNVHIGGLVGININTSTISECYATGSVTGIGDIGGDVGGLVGENSGGVTKCYATGLVTGAVLLGGLVGLNHDSYLVDDSFWDIETSGMTTSNGGSGLPTASMKSRETFTNVGWIFNNDAWAMADGLSYPLLAWQGLYSGGQGTSEDPYLISNGIDLFMIVENPACDFKMTEDIDLGEVVLSKGIGSFPDRPFTGTFDGNDYVISNFTLSGGVTDESGLFCYMEGESAGIRNLGLENVVIEANVSDHIGGLVGYNDSASINQCYVAGSVVAWGCTGLLVGYNNAGVINNCYTEGGVDGIEFVGGLIGCNWMGICTNCYSSADTWGLDYTGGLAGFNYEADISASFWDTQISGQVNGVGGNEGSGTVDVQGRTTEQMKQSTTFTDYNWDFVCESDNGTNDIWEIPIWFGQADYPRLTWQNMPTADISCPMDVNMIDFAYFSARWLRDNCDAPNDCEGADLDGSGVVDIADLFIFAGNYLKGP